MFFSKAHRIQELRDRELFLERIICPNGHDMVEEHKELYALVEVNDNTGYDDIPNNLKRVRISGYCSRCYKTLTKTIRP